MKYMDDGEIVMRYKQARDKKGQITILAELNACSIQEIKDVLKKAGLHPDYSREGSDKTKSKVVKGSENKQNSQKAIATSQQKVIIKDVKLDVKKDLEIHSPIYEPTITIDPNKFDCTTSQRSYLDELSTAELEYIADEILEPKIRKYEKKIYSITKKIKKLYSQANKIKKNKRDLEARYKEIAKKMG